MPYHLPKGSCVNAIYHVNGQIQNHNGKLYKEGSVQDWVIITHFGHDKTGKLIRDYLGFYKTNKPTNDKIRFPYVKHWYKLAAPPRVTNSFYPQPKSTIPAPVKGRVNFGDCFGVSYRNNKGIIDDHNGKFLYAVTAENKILYSLPQGSVNNTNIKRIVYIHQNFTSGKVLKPKAAEMNPTTYWLTETVSREGVHFIEIKKL